MLCAVSSVLSIKKNMPTRAFVRVHVCACESGGVRVYVLNEKEDAMKMNLHKLNFRKESNALNMLLGCNR